MAQTIEQALKQATLYTDGQVYELIALPPAAITAAAAIVAELGEPFCVLIADKDEITLVLPADALEEYGRRLPGHRAGGRYRLITLDVALEPTLVGFMARISSALAEAGIPIFPYAAHTRDHLLVPADQFDAAIAALERLRG